MKKGHVCGDIESFPLNKFHQRGTGNGCKVLILGESPAPNGWIVSGKACYRSDGKILPTGKRLNEYLGPFGLSVEMCGFTELSKCFVSKRSELESCGKKCYPILINQIKGAGYELIVVLGVKTTEIYSEIVGVDLPVGRISNVDIQGKSYKILPIFHPSPINPTGHAKNIALFKKHRTEIVSLLK